MKTQHNITPEVLNMKFVSKLDFLLSFRCVVYRWTEALSKELMIKAWLSLNVF